MKIAVKNMMVLMDLVDFVVNLVLIQENIQMKPKKKLKKSVFLKYDEYEKKDLVCENCNCIFHTRDMSRKQCYNCLPSTIKHTKVDKPVKTIKDCSSRTISKIVKRMKLPCTCCNFYVDGIVLDFHHIIERANNGTDNLDNLTYICPNCHIIAHTDKSKLTKPLISIDDYLKENNLDWKAYYFGYTESGE